MSFDLAIEQICTHLVVDEVVVLDLTDLRTIRTLRPIANSSLEVKINGFLVEHAADPLNGFFLERDTRSIDPAARQLKFRKLRRATDEFYQVTYYTAARNCRRCLGLRVENDYRYNQNGGSVAVTNEAKLIQDIKKIVLTEIQSNPFHLWYGTSIPALIGSKITNAGFIRVKMSGDIRRAIQRYADIQRRQAGVQTVTARERFGRIVRLDVNQDPIEVTAFNIVLVFTNQARDLLEMTEQINLPAPESLAYFTAEQDILGRGNFGRAG